MASSGDDLEDDIHGGQDVSGRKSGKKFLHPFRKMRRFFSNRRRGKSREDDVEDPPPGAVKSKSTTDVLRAGHEDDPDDESGQFVSNKTLSMSADSVFTPDPRAKDTNLEGLQSSARSMEHLGQPAFTNELFQKLKSRRNEDDEGLPSSPLTESIDFKKPSRKRHDSKQSVDSSMCSLEDELDDKNVFEQEWTTVVNSSRQNVNAMTDSQEALDLNAVTSTTSLVSDSAKFKIAVKPKNTRPSTHHRRPVRSPAPKPLTQLKETEESKADEKSRSSGSTNAESVLDSRESLDTKDPASSEDKESGEESKTEESEDSKVEIHVTADIESAVEQKRQSDSSKEAEDLDDGGDEKAEDKPEEPSKPADHPLTIITPKSDPKISPRTSPVPPPKSPRPQKKDTEAKRKSTDSLKEVEKKTEEVEQTEKLTPAKDGDSKPFNVVLRKTGRRTAIEELGTIRLRDNVGDRDPSKRQTIAGDTGLTIFGDRKATNRNSFVEASRSPEPKEESGTNEFSQVLNRLKKQPSRKKLIPNEDESDKNPSVQRKASQTSKDKAVVVESKPKLADTPVKVAESKPTVSVVTPQKVTESKPRIPEGKPKISETKPKISESKPKVAESKPKVAESKPKVAESKPKVTESKPKATETRPKSSEPKPIDHGPKTSENKVKEAKPEETPVVSKTPDVPKPKEKESVVVKRSESVKAKEPEVKPTAPIVTASPAKPESTEKKPSQAESKISVSKPTTPKSTTSPTTTTTTPAKFDSSKTPVSEKAKPVESKKPEVEKTEPKTPSKEEVKSEEKSSFKKESPAVKNRARSQTLTDQPVVQGANKENEKAIQRSNSQGDTVDEKPPPTAEPAWFTLARRKTANWDQKERDLEQKEKKETSNIAEKERDASTKGKEVTLTIDDAAKEDSKPALRSVVKCSNSAANRQSKVLDMAKLFQNQVS